MFTNLKNYNKIIFFKTGELGWSTKYWSCAVNKYIKDNPDKHYVIATFNDRMDLYKKYNDFFPIKIGGLYEHKRPNMYHVDFMEKDEYKKIIESIKNIYPNHYICEAPKTNSRNIFTREQQDFNFEPRPQHKKIIKDTIREQAGTRKVICLSPRHRVDTPNRNWIDKDYWYKLYDLIDDSGKFFIFVVGCGVSYVKPKIKYDGQCIQVVENLKTHDTSIIGLTIEAMKHSDWTVGVQSANPDLSLMVGTPALMWGKDFKRHTEEDNAVGTRCEFLECPKYDVTPEVVFNKLMEIS